MRTRSRKLPSYIRDYGLISSYIEKHPQSIIMLRTILPLCLFCLLPVWWSCETARKAWTGFSVFPVEEDIRLGAQVAEQIESDPEQFPLLAEEGNEKVYTFIRELRDRILETGKVKYAKEFKWQIKIIDNDTTLNAFATPGGYIYVYTGLIKFLDTEDQLAGVMGHEMAHADRRHSTSQLTKYYGLDAIRQIITGDTTAGTIEQIAIGLASLKFGREHETDADLMSVEYLCTTDYNSAGAAGFFKKMLDQPTPPEFLSTHPSPANRVESIEARAAEMSCNLTPISKNRLPEIKRLLSTPN